MATLGSRTGLLESLRGTGSSVAETLPAGHLTETRVGPVRTEQPLDGTALSATLECDPETFRRVLSTGFEWLRDFQVAFGNAHRRVLPMELERALTIPSLDLSPPAGVVSQPVQLFRHQYMVISIRRTSIVVSETIYTLIATQSCD
ncbi:hypothetical protein B2G88_12470 [Natronolimnobius baerhuensis]|uniref:Uncharacterized protein n=1 Tax=Natronolimnobius baerhuensis TaxID=253108 RepID=A0A202EAA6_9EURY|nr:hypothetical protein B2G88_12470 [Natronolimnobius baerhuensis]